MSLLDAVSNPFGGGSGQGPQTTPQQARQQLQNDPVGILKRANLTIPDNMNDPQQIVMYLFRTGQIGRNGMRVQRK